MCEDLRRIFKLLIDAGADKIMFHYSQRRAFANIIKKSPPGKYAATCGTNKSILNKKQGAVKNSRQKERLQVTEKGMLAVVFVV